MKEIYVGSNKKYMLIVLSYIHKDNWSEKYSSLLFKHYLLSYVKNNEQKEWLNNINPIRIGTDNYYVGDNMYYIHRDVIVLKTNETLTRHFIDSISYRNNNIQVPIIDENNNEYVLPILFNAEIISNSNFYIGNNFKECSYNDDMRRIKQGYIEHTKNYNIFDIPTINIYTTNDGNDNRYAHHRDYTSATKPEVNIAITLSDNFAEGLTNDKYNWKESIYFSNTGNLIAKTICDNSKLYMEKIHNTYILTDNKIGFLSIKEELFNSTNILNRFNLITVNQYHLGNGLIDLCFRGSGSYCLTSVLGLILMNKNRIDTVKLKTDIMNNPYVLGYNVLFVIDKKLHKKQIQTNVYKSKTNTYGGYEYNPMIIPYEKDKNIHNDAIKLLNKFLDPNSNPDQDLIYEYGTKILSHEDVMAEQDVLTKWFKICTSNAQTDQERLKNSYKQLRDGLVQEYKDIGLYLENHNISNKKPIPSITIDDKIRTNITNKIGFGFNTTTLRTIGYKQLNDELRKNDAYIQFRIPQKRRCYYMGTCSLYDCYDAKNNNIDISVNKMIELYRKGVNR